MHYNYALQLATRQAYEATPTLNFLCSLVERENLVRTRPTRLAQMMEVSDATVERHFNKLRKLGLVEPDEVEEGKKQGISSWRVCPFLAWRGTNQDLVRYLDALPANHIWREYLEPRGNDPGED